MYIITFKNKKMIKTNKAINITHYSSKKSDIKLRKLVFKDIAFTQDTEKNKFNISYKEYSVEDENVEQQVPAIDANGDFVFDKTTGEQVFETLTNDNLKFLRNVPFSLPRDVFYQVSKKVLSNAPNNLTRKQQDDLVVEMGIKIYIVQQEFYQGALTLTDFE